MPDSTSVKAEDRQSGIGRMLIDDGFHRAVMIPDQDTDILGCDRQASVFYEFPHLTADLNLFVLPADMKDPDVGMFPVGMTEKNKTQDDHQVGIFGILRSNPDMNPIFVDQGSPA